jgi:protein-S-isoprenylcysteine O-methyltransferase Ste14
VRRRLHRHMLLRNGPVSAVTSAWAALALYIVGLVLAFGVRTWLHVRRTGASGFHGISGRPGSLAWWGGVLFPAAVLLGLAAPVLVLVGATPRIEALAHPLITIAGFVLGIAGLTVVLFAQGAMGASWRIGVDDSERTDLVTDGLFRWIRNPIFTGISAVSAGVVLMAPTLIALLGLICLIAAVQIQVRVVEEPYLRRVHGAPYLRYMAAAGRFLPRIGTR